ncbi:hypothetical protein TIFTF001_017452 [Ficus carica]|uniref:Uncharacterized protein n=1 Tax=Ficus carica TaxID=3494 RepID=A0AA88A9J0_FICCA|nr:hypothetical protein TIFTF001_017452 [Ficus carica]
MTAANSGQRPEQAPGDGATKSLQQRMIWKLRFSDGQNSRKLDF